MGSLSQPRLNIFTVGNMRVMICLGQGGLRSLSASSCYYYYNVVMTYTVLLAVTARCTEDVDEVLTVCRITVMEDSASKLNSKPYTAELTREHKWQCQLNLSEAISFTGKIKMLLKQKLPLLDNKVYWRITMLREYHSAQLLILIIRQYVSVTWSVLSWSRGHEFEPRSGRTWGA